MKLHHQKIIDPQSTDTNTLLVLHGIFGMGKNWASVIKELIRRKPNINAQLIDLRLHGQSLDFPEPHTLETTAQDLSQLLHLTHDKPFAILGHSFGGKVALAYALKNPNPNLKELWIIDSTPDAYPPSGSAWQMIELIHKLPKTFESRKQVTQMLQEEGLHLGIAMWMASNIIKVEEHYTWRFDINYIETLIKDFFATDLWELVQSPPPGLNIHFVKAEKANVLKETACEKLLELNQQNGQIHLHRIDAGHWIHVDNPKGLLNILDDHLIF